MSDSQQSKQLPVMRLKTVHCSHGSQFEDDSLKRSVVQGKVEHIYFM